MTPETTVLVEYANETLTLRIRCAAYEARIRELEAQLTPTDENGDSDAEQTA